MADRAARLVEVERRRLWTGGDTLDFVDRNARLADDRDLNGVRDVSTKMLLRTRWSRMSESFFRLDEG